MSISAEKGSHFSLLSPIQVFLPHLSYLLTLNSYNWASQNYKIHNYLSAILLTRHVQNRCRGHFFHSFRFFWETIFSFLNFTNKTKFYYILRAKHEKSKWYLLIYSFSSLNCLTQPLPDSLHLPDSANLYQTHPTSTRLTQPLPNSHNLYQTHNASTRLT